MNKGILLSGGIDSIALAYMEKPDVAFTIDYGQKPAEKEIEVSTTICKLLKIQHEIIRVNCANLGSGDLAGEKSLSISPSSEWWPYRNQLLITLSAMRAIVMDIEELMLASVKSDNFHKDGTAEFYDKMNHLMVYQEGAISITCPSINLLSSELVKASRIPYEILLYAHSCHISNIPCGYCPGCLKHLRVKQDLKIE